MTENDYYDFIIIGGGPAAQGAAEVASFFGHRTLVIEKNVLGGVVVTTGGAPTKTLRDAALYLTGFHDRAVYGLTAQIDPALAGKRIRSRTAEVCAAMQECVRSTFIQQGVDIIYGVARLGENKTVFVAEPNQAGERKFSAKRILIATGSSPARPRNIFLDDPNVYDSEKLFTIPRLPKSIVVVGGGAIGCEYASIFTAVGVAVTLVHSGERLLDVMDGEMAQLAASLFEGMGINLKLRTYVNSINRSTDDLLEVKLDNNEILRPEIVLLALGRLANTDGLGLKKAGVQVDDHHQIKVNHQFQTTAEGIYAAGDVIHPSLSSVSMEQGRVAACHAFNLTFKEAMDTLPVWAVYSVPEVAGVGLTEEEAKHQGIDYEVGRASFETLPRGIIAGHTEGMLKLIFRRDDHRLLGVHIVGDIASELIGIGQATIHAGEKIDLFNRLTFATPTYTMAYKFAAFDGFQRLVGARYQIENSS